MLRELFEKVSGLFSLLWREVMKFGVVGGIAFVIDTAVFLWMMNGPLEGSEVKAKVVGGVVATMFSWVANRFWTFRHRRRASVVRELLMFLLMNGIGLFIAAACVWVTKYWLGLTDQTSLFVAGSVVGLVLGTIFRFFAYRFWVFTEELDAEPAFEHDHELLHAVHHHDGVHHVDAAEAPVSSRAPAEPAQAAPSSHGEEPSRVRPSAAAPAARQAPPV